jgi:hypothetical protein
MLEKFYNSLLLFSIRMCLTIPMKVEGKIEVDYDRKVALQRLQCDLGLVKILELHTFFGVITKFLFPT